MRARRWAEADRWFSLHIRAHPQDVDGYRARGSLRGRGEADVESRRAALLDYSEAIRLAPERADLYLCRALINHALDRPADAVPDYQQYLSAHPDAAAVHQLRASCEWSVGNTAAALDGLNTALRLEPGFALARGLRGVLRLENQDHAEAASDLQQALALDPNLPMEIDLQAAQQRLDLGWRRYLPEDGGFEIWLPGEPRAVQNETGFCVGAPLGAGRMIGVLRDPLDPGILEILQSPDFRPRLRRYLQADNQRVLRCDPADVPPHARRAFHVVVVSAMGVETDVQMIFTSQWAYFLSVVRPLAVEPVLDEKKSRFFHSFRLLAEPGGSRRGASAAGAPAMADQR